MCDLDVHPSRCLQMLCPLKEAAFTAGSSFALIDSQRSWTFAELNDLTERATASLERMGIAPFDRVALLYPASAEWIALFFALLRLHAVLCPLHLRLPPLALEAFCRRIQPRLILDASTIHSLFTHSARSSQETIFPDETSLLIATSGSTGIPKIAMLSVANCIASALPANALFQLRSQDVWLLALPLYHVGGIAIVWRALLAHATLLLDATQQQRATHLSYVPTQLYRMKHLMPNLRTVLIGGAALSEQLYLQFRHLPLYLSYGMTEMSSFILASSTPVWIHGRAFLGFPLEGRELRIDHHGEIWVRGSTRCIGYWNQEPPWDHEGWFPTGDLGLSHPEYGIAIVGRKDWQFISGGENIQPEEIEQILLRLPGMEEALVVPRIDREFGQRPVLFARSHDPAWNFETMQKALQPYLPSYKIPVSLHDLEPLPEGVLKRDRKSLINKLASN